MTHLLDDYHWLIGDEAKRWIAETQACDDLPVVRVGRLRKALSQQRARLILEQVDLRHRAREKFPEADKMFFTRIGLEQATDSVVAAYKAMRFPITQPVADLCCGVGGDLLALAARGPTLGVERDPVTAVLAQANGQAIGLFTEPPAEMATPITSTVCSADVTELEPIVRSFRHESWHIDPDRRPVGKRTTRVELHEPGVPVIERLLASWGNAAIKLAPAAGVPERWVREAELEWISRGRECRQLVAWFGRLARYPGCRTATILRKGAPDTPGSVRTVLGAAASALSVAGRVGHYVFEPDAAVLAANLTGALAAEHRLESISMSVGYLTSDRPVSDPALACFEVQEIVPFDLKRLKKLLRERGIGRLEIKKRGVTDLPEQLRRRLELSGENSGVLLLARGSGRVFAILAQRWQGEEA